ncbi:FHA domain [Leishmania braziliensis]|nr:FHA domain [Leishmania braziliensis]
MPSTAATQIVSCCVSSPPPLTTDVDISGPFLLYGPSGRLLSRCEPSDLWGLLISEHTALNCTYAQTTVRIGRTGDCDTVLNDPRVSSTHFTISLELEPHGDSDLVQKMFNSRHAGHSESSTDGNDYAVPLLPRRSREGKHANAYGATSSAENGPESAVLSDLTSWLTLPSPAATRAGQRHIEQGATAATAVTNLIKNGRPKERALSETSLPGWRVRRVLLTDCSANGTYVNDVLVGRGKYCELHYGDDISVVRVLEKKRFHSGSTTLTPLSSEEDEAQQEAEKEVADFVKGKPCAKLRHGSEAASPPPAQHFTRSSRDALTGCGTVRVGAEVNEEGNSPSSDDPHVAQMFTALLSTLSTEHTYVERFCFHLYQAEEVGRGGVPITEPETVAAPQKSAGGGEASEERHGETQAEQDKYDDALQHPQTEQKHNLLHRTSVGVPRRLSSTSLEPHDGNGGNPASHHKSIRFPDDPVTTFDSPPENADSDAVVSPSVSLSTLQYRGRHSSLLSPPLPPLAPVPSDTVASAAPNPHSSACSSSSSVSSLRALSTVVTPHSLLRSRPSIRESFIAPINLTGREKSAAPSNGAMQGSITASTAEIHFQESIGSRPALQCKAAAQQALAARCGGSTASSQTNGGLGTVGKILKDMPADIPIRYAVLPLRHLQWGGRIGFGASGDVFMGIDVSTATVIAIKVLKGSSLFQPSPSADTAVATGHSKTISRRPTAPLVQDDATILSLSDISLSNVTLPVPGTATEVSTPVSLSSGSPTTALPRSAGRVDGKADTAERTSMLPSLRFAPLQGNDANGESIQVSEASTPLTLVSAATSSSASVHGNTSAALVSASSTCCPHAQTQQRSPRLQPRDEHSALPLLRKHLREIIFLTTLQHHRIVHFLGFQFSSEGRLCLLMEYVAGGTLQTLVKNFGVFEENVIRLYTLQILEGLVYLRRKGVVHGDLKSANILVSEQGSVKLTDFGTSRFLRTCAAEKETGEVAETGNEQQKAEVHRRDKFREGHHPPADRLRQPCHHDNSAGADAEEADSGGEDVSVGNSERCGGGCRCSSDVDLCSDDVDSAEDDGPEHRVLCGTPLYMSPELIRTQEPSFASDMWALGCVVYEMATGGVLPWRPVHNSSAPTVVWYIGQRSEDGEGPSMDDVYTERDRLNRTSSNHSLHETGDDAYDEQSRGHRGHSGRGSGDSVGRLDRTPSPMLLDLLQSTLSLNPERRPTPAELLQHPFIRNEASEEALVRWHAVVAANRCTEIHSLKQHGEAVEAVSHRKMKAEPGAATKSTLRSVSGSASGDDSLHARASLSPARTSPSRKAIHVKELVDITPAKLGGKNPLETASKQKHPLLHPPPPLGESIMPPLAGTRLSCSGESSTNLLGDSWEEVESPSLLPLPLPASQPKLQMPKAHSSQIPSVLGAGNPDSQPLICEPPRRPAMRGCRMDASQSVIGQSAVAPELLPSASYDAATVRWYAPQSFSAPTKLPVSRPRASAAPPAGRQQTEQQVPYSMPVAQKSTSKSYMRQHQLFLKQNELERRRLSFLVPHGGRQVRGRLRTEGPSPPQPQLLPVSSAPAQVGASILPMYPPSYQCAMQHAVLEYTPGYSDYNPQVNTQTVEMCLPPSFTSQSLSIPEQQGEQQNGNNGSSRMVMGVRPQRNPSRQNALSLPLRGNKQKHSSRRESARNAPTNTAAANVSPSLHPNSCIPAIAMSSSHVRGPVLSHTLQHFVPPQPLSMQGPHPVVGGLIMKTDNPTIPSPLLLNFTASMGPLQVQDHRYTLGYSSTPMSADQLVSKPQQAGAQGPILPLPSNPCHRHTTHSQSPMTRSLGSGNKDDGSAVQQASLNSVTEVERAVSSTVQRNARRGRKGRPNTLSSSNLLLRQGGLQTHRHASPLLRQQQQQLSLTHIHTRGAEHSDKQQQQQEESRSTEPLCVERPTRKSSSTHTAGKKRRIRTSSRIPTKAVSQRQQQRRLQQ